MTSVGNKTMRSMKAGKQAGLLGSGSSLPILCLWAGALGMLSGEAASQSQAPGSAAVQIPAQIYTIDPQSLAQERRELRVVDRARDALQRSGAPLLFAPAATEEISLREAALEALRKNLDIQQARVGADISRRALDEADAVFDPVLAATFGASIRSEWTRIETPDERFRTGTERVALNQVDSKGIFRCTQTAANLTQGPDAGVACHVITFDPANRPPVTALQFLRERPEGFYPSFPIEAHEPSATLPSHEEILTSSVSFFQQLPWGASLNLSVSTTRDEAFYPLGGLDPDNFGNYQRPYFSSITLGASLPLPFSKNFGPDSAASDVNQRIARASVDAADFTVKATINDTLLSLDTVYWTLVGTLQRLKVTMETIAAAREQRSAIQRLYDEGFVTESDLAQAQAQVSRLQTTLQQIFGQYVTASETMRELLARDEEVLLLPVGYRSVMRRGPADIAETARIFNNASYQRQAVAVRIAGIQNLQAMKQTRPDLTGSVSVTLAQSGTFGYMTATESLGALTEPDFISLNFALSYIYPWGNRAAEASYLATQRALSRQRHILDQVELSVRETFESSRVTAQSAMERVRIADRSAQLAGSIYDRSVRLQDEGFVAAYESLSRLIDLLNTRLTSIQAQVEARIAESQLLASVSALGERYAERTAQTDADLYRLAMLRATGALQHFGGPL